MITIAIAHSWKSHTPELHLFHSDKKALEFLIQNVDGAFPRSNDKTPLGFLCDYNDWVRKNDNMCVNTFDIKRHTFLNTQKQVDAALKDELHRRGGIEVGNVAIGSSQGRKIILNLIQKAKHYEQ